MNFLFGSDTHQQKNQSNLKPKQKELQVQINLKNNEKKQKQNIIGEKFKIQAKKNYDDHQNPSFSEQQHYMKNSAQSNIRKTNQHAQHQKRTKQKQITQQNQPHQAQIQNKSPTKRSINLVKRIRTKVTDKSSNRSPNIQKKSNQLEVNIKLPPSGQQNSQKTKSIRVLSLKKVQNLVTPIKSSKLISPSKNKKQNQQKQIQNKKIVNYHENNRIKDIKVIKQIKKREFSIEENPKSIPKKKTLEQPKSYGKSHSVTKPKQGTHIYPSNMNAMNIEESIKQEFQNQLYNSERGMKFLEKKFIGDKISDSENVVYNALVSQKTDQYLKGMYQNIYPENQFIKSSVDETINQALQNVSNNWEGQIVNKSKIKASKRIAPKNKDDLKELEKIDRLRLLKIKQGQVKSKVGDLRNQLQQQYFFHKKIIQIDPIDALMPDYYSIDHPQTIKAQNLIRSLQQKRKSQHRQYQEHISRKAIQKQRISQIEKQYEQKFKQERRQKLKQYYEQKHEERELQKLEMKKKEQEFKDWIKIYERERPLEEKFEQEMVMKMIIPEIQARHRKLQKIKESRKPIDIQDINEHEKRYMDFKKDENIRQRAQLQSKIECDDMNEQNSNRHYKGKYRYLVLQSMYQQQNQTDPKQIERSKKLRQLSYSDQVRYVHQSLIKRKEGQDEEDTRTLVRRVRNHDGSVGDRKNSHTIDVSTEISSDRHQRRNVESTDAYAQGLKNLQYAKSHVRQKLMNGEEKKPKIQLIQIRQKHNYLDELKEKRLQNSLISKNHQNPTNIQSIIGNDIETIKAKIEGMDQKLKRKELKHRHKHPRDQNPSSNRQIQDDYLDSINAKLQIVQQLK